MQKAYEHFMTRYTIYIADIMVMEEYQYHNAVQVTSNKFSDQLYSCSDRCRCWKKVPDAILSASSRTDLISTQVMLSVLWSCAKILSQVTIKISLIYSMVQYA